MANQTTHNEHFERHRAAVLIPTYNNAATLGAVLTDALSFTKHVIVVNDGATDETLAVLDQFPDLQRVSYSPNRGKGIALRRGFAYALTQGYDYVITMDADGQHFAADLPSMLEQVEANPGALIIGARNLHQENMPGKSTSANKVSNFWFHVTTGLKGPDTQSGYRLYPLFRMRKMRFLCTKYEFEIEVLVRSSWRGIKVDWTPVKVYYPPPEERVSHFRPVPDVTRITILNIVLVFITFLYIKPRDLIRFLLKGENWKKMWKEEVLKSDESNVRKAASIGFGIFMGIIPIWGFQLLVAILLSIKLKLNKALVLLSAHVSTPPLTPFVLFASFLAGRLWMGQTAKDLIFTNGITFETIKENMLQYVYGSITLAILGGLLTWGVSFVLLTVFRRQKK
ncbi:glycosyltransferase involved in cell wall biosynthesis [Chitinophaga niastensis]|uniref:Glycosyltransferase involved in cell wall biosynthesis n=1 Tax=Chitinophaga niastensis TaxID=536980 RepID=A0A2P8HN30_CHINA|nr:DUF2062 domain-containing protein [Chitinophaga niastensis]PSL47614.1 glycosyltransferase involved in cell wall biosynthesis [Chitinophaga niastensis]